MMPQDFLLVDPLLDFAEPALIDGLPRRKAMVGLYVVIVGAERQSEFADFELPAGSILNRELQPQ